MTRDIGIKVKTPKQGPEKTDKKNPFNGTLSVRGKLFEGKVVKNKAKNTVVIQKESPMYFSKFKRYATKQGRDYFRYCQSFIKICGYCNVKNK